MTDATHPCPVGDCATRVPRKYLACEFHWAKLTPTTRRSVYAAYRSMDAGRCLYAMTAAVDEMTFRANR